MIFLTVMGLTALAALYVSGATWIANWVFNNVGSAVLAAATLWLLVAFPIALAMQVAS